MLKFYKFVNEQKVPTLSAKLSWSHYDELLKFDNVDKINYYIIISKQKILSVRELRKRIKSNEYERLDEETKQKLINNEKLEIKDIIPEPIINNKSHYENITEKILQKMILEDIDSIIIVVQIGLHCGPI